MGARASFDGFSPAQQREYVEWVTEATQKRRLRQAVEWIAQGKTRNWRYR